MSKTIIATKATVEALATAIDAESRLPYASERCACGEIAIDIADRYAQTVRCRKCGKVTSAGARAATIQVHAVAVAKDGTAAYPCDEYLATRITDAAKKPSKDRTPTEVALAACSTAVVEAEPVPKEIP
jgi:hypothetical protein